MECRLREKVPALVVHLMQRFGSALSASALRISNAAYKERNGRSYWKAKCLFLTFCIVVASPASVRDGDLSTPELAS